MRYWTQLKGVWGNSFLLRRQSIRAHFFTSEFTIALVDLGNGMWKWRKKAYFTESFNPSIRPKAHAFDAVSRYRTLHQQQTGLEISKQVARRALSVLFAHFNSLVIGYTCYFIMCNISGRKYIHLDVRFFGFTTETVTFRKLQAMFWGLIVNKRQKMLVNQDGERLSRSLWHRRRLQRHVCALRMSTFRSRRRSNQHKQREGATILECFHVNIWDWDTTRRSKWQT